MQNKTYDKTNVCILLTVDCVIPLKLQNTHQATVLNIEREVLQNHVGKIKKEYFISKIIKLLVTVCSHDWQNFTAMSAKKSSILVSGDEERDDES